MVRRGGRNMGMSARCAIGALLTALVCTASEPVPIPPQFALAPEPSWADPVPASFASVPTSREAISDGIRYLVIDNQVRLGPTNASYNHYAYRFLTAAGVADRATIQVQFDPSYEMLQFHRLRLWRGTNCIDCLRMGTFRTFQREESLEWQLLDGRLTVVAVPEDVRVGDVVEYAYTIAGGNPVFNGRYAGTGLLGWTVPVDQQRLRMLVPPERVLARRLHGAGAPEPVERDAGGCREWLWDLTNTAPVQLEGSLPVWYKPLSEVAFSEYASWADVARWAAALYEPTGATHDALAPQLSAWRRLPAGEDRALAALQFVQDEIRYFGLELGSGSHRPNPPDVVLQRRFGDCKDKAVLLCALLGDLGIEAHPALVNVCARQELEQELPSPFAFDHVIVAARVDGATVWLDPTRAHQHGRLRDHYLPPYGMALIATRNTTGLLPVDRGGSGEPQTRIHERFAFSRTNGPTRLTVRTVYCGRDADICRARLANTPQTDLERQCLNYYAQRYPSVQSDGGLQVEDARDANVMTITERYRIRETWSPDQTHTNRQSCAFDAQELQPYVQQPATVLRSMPLGLSFPVDVEQTMEIVLPHDWTIEPERQTISDAFLRFDFSIAYTGRVLTLHYRLRTLADAVPTSQVPAHLAIRRMIRNTLEYTVYQQQPGATPAPGKRLFTLNWPLVCLCGVWCALLAVVWNRLYHYRPQPPPLPELTAGTEIGPTGLGGWLVLPAIGLMISPFLRLHDLYQLRMCFDAARWQILTTPGAAAYHVLWRPTLLLELLSGLFNLAFVSLLLVLFFRRRAAFPNLLIAFLLINLVIVSADFAISTGIPAVNAHASATALQDAARTLLAACIWISYLSVSRRVRNTFRQ